MESPLGGLAFVHHPRSCHRGGIYCVNFRTMICSSQFSSSTSWTTGAVGVSMFNSASDIDLVISSRASVFCASYARCLRSVIKIEIRFFAFTLVTPIKSLEHFNWLICETLMTLRLRMCDRFFLICSARTVIREQKIRRRNKSHFCLLLIVDHRRANRGKSHSEWLMRRRVRGRKANENPFLHNLSFAFRRMTLVSGSECWKGRRCTEPAADAVLREKFVACLNISWSVKASQFPWQELELVVRC